MAALDDHDILTDVDDPDVAFLSGSDEVDLRSRSPAASRERKKGLSSSRHKPSKLWSPKFWSILLFLLVAALLVALVVILYRRSEKLSALLNFNSPAAVEKLFNDGQSDKESPIGSSSSQNSKSINLPKFENALNLTDCLYKKTRLPDTCVPNAYDLDLHPDSGLQNYSGSVLIEISILKPSSLIVLHSSNLDILNVSLWEVEDESANNLVSRSQGCAALSQLQLVTKKLLDVDKKYKLKIYFHGALSQLMQGFYVSSYLGPDGINRTLATTQFEDTHARSAFPCFDEPAMKAVFRIRLEHDSNTTALSNTNIRNSQVFPETGRVVDEFEETVPMSTYLLAFIICDFGKRTVFTEGSRKLEINGYAVKHKLDQLDFSLKTAAQVISFYEQFFGIEYPLKKLDLIAIPDFAAGAMENWGLITFRESTLLFDETESSLTQKELVAQVVAHEIAHQWFGNLVTMTWWDQLWLNEGFATFMEYLGSNASDPSLLAWEQFSTNTIQQALFKDTLQKTHAVVADVEDATEITSRFDAISYLKGASILRMLYEALTPQIFTNGVSDYLSKHKYKNAETKDLWNALNEAWQKGSSVKSSDLSVAQIADSWTNQAGYPIVMAKLRDGTLSISQQKMIAMKAVDSVKDSSKWIIPVSAITDDGSRVFQWLNEGSMEMRLKPSLVRWFKLNVHQTGFYRVNYELENWNALADYLKSGKWDDSILMPEDRSNLLDDAFSLARAGKLNVSVALNLASYLDQEMHYLPWFSTTPHFAGIENLLFETENFNKFRKWRSRMAGSVFSKVNCINEINNKSSLRRLCIQIFEEACDTGVELCKQQARELFVLLRSKNQRVPADIRRTVYRTAIKHGDEEDWEYLWQRFQTTQIASEKSLVLAALTTTENIWLIERLIRYSLDSKLVRPSYTVGLWISLSINYYARQSVWKAVRHHWDFLFQRYGDETAISNLFTALQWMTSNNDLADLKAFFEQPGRKLGAGSLAYQQTVETIQLHREFIDLAEKDISTWLQKFTVKA